MQGLKLKIQVTKELQSITDLITFYRGLCKEKKKLVNNLVKQTFFIKY